MVLGEVSAGLGQNPLYETITAGGAAVAAGSEPQGPSCAPSAVTVSVWTEAHRSSGSTVNALPAAVLTTPKWR